VKGVLGALSTHWRALRNGTGTRATAPLEALNPEYLRREIAFLDELGPRFTGTASHERLIDHVAAQWQALGLEVHEDLHTFTRWEMPHGPRDLAFTVGGRSLEVASVFPYSGTTGQDGVSGPLRRMHGPLPHWRAARGGIAVVELHNRSLPASSVIGTWDEQEAWEPMANPLIPAVIAGLGLGRARRAGVKAVVFAWRGISAANARGQYIPFILPYQDIPAVFVAGTAAHAVLRAAAHRVSASLVLNARLSPNTRTRTLWAAVEGQRRPQETLLAVSHSDGTNVVEENGHIALTSIAKDLVASPPERSVVLVLTTGHLRIPALTKHGQATTRWLEDHRELWAGGAGERKAVAGLAIEHLGAREYRDDPAREEYGPSGRLEPELLYASTPELKRLVDREWQPAPGVRPRVSAPSPLIHFGEGEPLFQQRIPAIALVTAPQYLLATLRGELVDIAALQRQIDGFRRLLRRMDALPRASFGSVAVANGAAKALAAGKVILSLVEHEAKHAFRRALQR
jgi:hypothetical protein